MTAVQNHCWRQVLFTTVTINLSKSENSTENCVAAMHCTAVELMC